MSELPLMMSIEDQARIVIQRAADKLLQNNPDMLHDSDSEESGRIVDASTNPMARKKAKINNFSFIPTSANVFSLANTCIPGKLTILSKSTKGTKVSPLTGIRDPAKILAPTKSRNVPNLKCGSLVVLKAPPTMSDRDMVIVRFLQRAIDDGLFEVSQLLTEEERISGKMYEIFSTVMNTAMNRMVTLKGDNAQPTADVRTEQATALDKKTREATPTKTTKAKAPEKKVKKTTLKPKKATPTKTNKSKAPEKKVKKTTLSLSGGKMLSAYVKGGKKLQAVVKKAKKK